MKRVILLSSERGKKGLSPHKIKKGGWKIPFRVITFLFYFRSTNDNPLSENMGYWLIKRKNLVRQNKLNLKLLNILH